MPACLTLLQVMLWGLLTYHGSGSWIRVVPAPFPLMTFSSWSDRDEDGLLELADVEALHIS